MKPTCKNCLHFRAAPYEAKIEGCYHPTHMQGKQKDAYLDEQQLPGDHEVINRRNDCAEFEAEPIQEGFFARLFRLGA